MIDVVFITKGKLVAAKVDERKLRINGSFELGWDNNTFDIAFSHIIEKLKTKKIRILLDDAYSYVLRVTVPTNLSDKEERIFVSQKIKEKIPEILLDRDWDYKEIQFNVSKNKDLDAGAVEKEVIVFSPVKYLMDLLASAIKKVGIDVEAIESVELALTRNTNPIIGTFLKVDINGSDKDILNIPIATTVSPTIKGESFSEYESILEVLIKVLVEKRRRTIPPINRAIISYNIIFTLS